MNAVRTFSATEQKIIDIIFATLELDIDREAIRSNSTFKDLGISSFEIITLIFEFEEAYNIQIETEDMFTLKTLAEVAAFIELTSANA